MPGVAVRLSINLSSGTCVLVHVALLVGVLLVCDTQSAPTVSTEQLEQDEGEFDNLQIPAPPIPTATPDAVTPAYSSYVPLTPVTPMAEPPTPEPVQPTPSRMELAERRMEQLMHDGSGLPTVRTIAVPKSTVLSEDA